MRLALLYFCILSLPLTGCGTSPVQAPVSDQSLRPHTTARHHVVAAGETLYAIAWQYGLDYRQLARINGIKPPYLIRTGQRLALRASQSARPEPDRRRQEGKTKPPDAKKTRHRTVADKPAARDRPARPVVPVRQTSGKEKGRTRPSSGPVGKGKTPFSPKNWRWPATGKIRTGGWARQGGRKGIQIMGKRGQPVVAANAGRVVYSGSGLRGYGRLIIIKHDDTYLSAYGHNEWLMVKQGDHVAAGQKIATMGSRYGDGPALYFEVRKNGKPVNPLTVLPRQQR